MKTLSIKSLELPELISSTINLNPTGLLKTSPAGLTYLDISDDYIHQPFPYLQDLDKSIEKPGYFSTPAIGAHISVIYPEENTFIQNEDLRQEYTFGVTGVFVGELELKKYYAFAINCPSLLKLRKKYGLAEQLCFKSHLVNLHMTIGVSF